METVTKVVHAASTAIWGEGNDSQSTQQHGEEPISGVQGKGAANDPYDAGNRDEQPSAPFTEIDPIAQEPTLDYKSQTLDAKTDATGTAAPDLNSTTAVTLPKPTETPTSNAQTQSLATEQRSTDNTDKLQPTENAAAAGGSGSGSGNSNSSGSAKQGVSKEALEGPQGPAPTPASEFEDEAKGKKPAAKETKPVESESPASSSSAKSDTSAKSPSKASSGSGDGNGNGKHSTLAKVKEGLKKVAHPRHGSKSSSSS
ncbi:hypothetical protein N7533_003030 [Penicillium manginii]|uniref:uncharacterized protein n=1 Tax=Penicillium manginii TaxID=203109 RepID=UPI002546771F|nr:uncharacterized protein N7533_003030 [Penicillium manginii]KAJ5764349.1 hypothetical protein N7533_003030 [Penicillium manginii]